MKINDVLDNTKMYRLPYSKNDNPNGWIEVTTHCNMKCPGCYKGIDREGLKVVHEPLDKIKSDILELKRIRNCGIITITGGEALMHPQIEEIVSFTKSLKLRSFIHTNGILINEATAIKLKKAGLTGFIVRVDTLNRPAFEKETQLHPLRSNIAALIKKVGELQLGFTAVVTQKNIAQIPTIVEWFQENNDKTDYLVLILKREFRFEQNEVLDTKDEATIHELTSVLKTAFPDIAFSSYLGSRDKNIDFKWVQAAWLASRGKVLGYADPRMVELSTVMAHFKNGNYSYVYNEGRNYVSFFQIMMGAFMLKPMRRILWRLIKNPYNLFKKTNHQVINIVNPPGTSPESMGFCDACPDAVLYEGILQPSCILESIIQLNKEKNA